MFIQYITQNCSPNQPWRSCIKKIWHLKIEETFLKEHGWLMILVCFKPSTVQQNEKHGETWFLQFLGKKKESLSNQRLWTPTNSNKKETWRKKFSSEGRNVPKSQPVFRYAFYQSLTNKKIKHFSELASKRAGWITTWRELFELAPTTLRLPSLICKVHQACKIRNSTVWPDQRWINVSVNILWDHGLVSS